MILVAGVPRSGTTWIAKILSQPSYVRYYHEPDNEHNDLLGYIYKQKIPRFPYLTSHDSRNGIYDIYDNVIRGKYIFGFDKSSLFIKKLLNINIETVEEEIAQKNESISSITDPSFKLSIFQHIQKNIAKLLFKMALPFQSDISSKERPLIKSVHSILALSYLQHYFNPRIVVVLRHPANIISSHLKLDNPDIWRNIFRQQSLMQNHISNYKSRLDCLDHPLEKAGAQVSAFYFVLDKQLAQNPDWIIAKHENFCLDPHTKFKDLYRKLNLEWSDKVKNKISELNQRGEGYAYQRVAEKQINKWKKRLDSAEVKHIKKGYSIFPSQFYQDFSSE